MLMLWLIYTLASIFLFASMNILEKYIMEKHVSDPIVATIVGMSIGFLALLSIVFFQDITIPQTTILVIAFLSGFVYFIAVFTYWKAVSLEEISRIIGLSHPLYALFTVLLAVIFLNEILSPIKYIGILLIMIASFLISLKKEGKFKISKAFWLMIVCSLGLALHAILLKYVLADLSTWNAFFWSNVGAFFAVPFFIPFHYKKIQKTIKKNKKVVFYLGISSIVSLIASLLIIFALSYGYVSVVTSVESTQPILTFLMATLVSIFIPRILKEELKGSNILIKIIAIVIGVFGTILLM